MKGQKEPGIDHFGDRYSDEELAARNLAAGAGGEERSVLPINVNPGRPSRHATRERLSLLVSLLFAVVMLTAPVASPAQVAVGVSVTFGPPPLPVYAQPFCPGPGFVWVPGYWAWDPAVGYYWVPGIWVLAPFVGALWTPGYWAWSNGVYVWYEGYWGPVVGFYGGVNYGYGYSGFGYDGGYWSGGRFYYNRAVNNINVTNITTVYSKNVRNVRPIGPSFNGGPGGTTIRPTAEQLGAARQRHSALTDAQRQQMQVARTDPKQRATVNRGRPAIAATTKPGVFTGHGVTGAGRGGVPGAGRGGVPEAGRGGVPGAGRGGVSEAGREGVPHKASPSYRAVPGERVRTPKPGAEMHPPVTERGHIAPGTQRQEPERRINEPRPAPQRPEATKPSPRKEENKSEREEPR